MIKLIRLFLFCAVTMLYGQELPPITNYSTIDYKGENQNWSIAQGIDAHIYVANNHNLLEFDGVNWTKYESPNASIFRSVATKDSLVYTGQYMEFGYWKKNPYGRLEYTSISSTLETPMLEDEEFWNIIVLDDWVLFQSLDRIYSYGIEDGQFNVLEAKSTKAHIFKVDGTVYFQNRNLGVYRIENGRPELIIDHHTLKDKNVVGMYRENDAIIVILENAKFYKIVDGETMQYVLPASKALQGLSVYCTEKLRDGSYVLGTIGKGMYQIAPNGELLRIIDQRKGLNNNTVLYSFQDLDENLWLGLDNGISVININSPFNEYRDNLGRLGLVYTSIVHEDNLYLGTNQGLFVKPRESESDFELIEGTDGQVWSIAEIYGSLFCGHNKGTFLISGNKAELISSQPGTWGIKPLKGREDILLQGNYDGLSVLKKGTGSQWSFGHRIKGFDISSRFFEQIDTHKILVNHEYKGLYELILDENFKEVVEEDNRPIMGYGSSIVDFKNKVYYTSLEGAFIKHKDSFYFTPDTILNQLLFEEAGGVKSILIPDTDANRMWCYTKNGLSFIYPKTFNSSLDLKTIPIPSIIRGNLGVSGFENLKRIADETYVIGMSNGFVVLNMNKLTSKSYDIQINNVSSQTGLESPNPLPLSDGTKLGYKHNTISFSYTVPEFNKYSEVEYQYRLAGLFDDWSQWSDQTSVTFTNLSFGNYRFEVRGNLGDKVTNNIAAYDFQIERPWYSSITAMVLYTLSFFAVCFVVHKIYKTYYTKKQDRLLTLEKKKQKRKN